MNNLKSALPLILALLLPCSANAKDLGVQGQIFEIIEIDFRQLLLESAARADWDSIQAQTEESAKNFLSRLPPRYLPQAQKTTTHWTDPSVVLTEDIKAPVRRPDGSYVWEVLIPKGTRVNPLVKLRPATAFLMFDGSRPEQIAFVRDILAKEPDRFIPVEAGAGNVAETNKILTRPVFHANDAMVSRFGVRELPALVYPGAGAHRLQIATTVFGPPLNPEDAHAIWPNHGVLTPLTRSRTSR